MIVAVNLLLRLLPKHHKKVKLNKNHVETRSYLSKIEFDIQLNKVATTVNVINHVDSFSRAYRSICQEPSKRPIKLILTQAIANEAIRIG